MTSHDPALVETVAEALWLDQFPDREWKSAIDIDRLTHEGHARAVLDAIATSPRHALVELPEVDDIADEFVFRNGGVRQYDPNGFGAYRFFTAKEIPALVAALLSLTRAAESGSTTPETKGRA